MTVFGMTSQPFTVSQRTWLAEDHGTEVAPGVALDLTLFNAAQHYPNGFIPDGVVLAKVTASGKYAPYLPGASNGQQTAVGISLNPVGMYQLGSVTGALVTTAGVAMLVHGFVNPGNLPFTSGGQALGGYLDSAAQTALRNIIFLPTVA